MEESRLELAWEQEEVLEIGLKGRRKTQNQPRSTPDTNGVANFNNGEEKVKDSSQQNGTKIDEDEQEQQKPEYCVYYDTDKGTESHFESSGLDENGVNGSPPKENPEEENIEVTKEDHKNANVVDSVYNGQNGEHEKHNFSHTSLRPTKISFDKHHEIESAEAEIEEFDVETVIKKQETHDLYCPNCNSCITKRVILRKRKRINRIASEDGKRNKPESPFPSQPNNVLNGGDGADVSLDDNEREPDVFRCLSCFSIFMPTGDGFKLFRMFGNKSDEQNSEGSQKPVRVKKGWLSSIFSSNKTETSTGQGSGHGLVGENNDGGASIVSSDVVGQNGLGPLGLEASSSSLSEPNSHISDINRLVSPSPSASIHDNAESLIKRLESYNGFPKEKGEGNSVDRLITSYHMQSNTSKDGVNTVDQSITSYHLQSNNESGATTVDQSTTSYWTESNSKNETKTVDQSSSSYHMHSDSKTSENASASASVSASPRHNGLKFLVPSNVGSWILENTQTNQKLDPMSSPDVTSEVSGSQPQIFQNDVEIHGAEPSKVDRDASTSPMHDVLLFHEKQIKFHEDLKNIARTTVSTGKDSLITIGTTQVDASAPQTSPASLAMTGNQTPQRILTANRPIEEGTLATVTESRSLDIVKSIVFGGLMESIASLSVVSSAAGSGTATLNVLALGMANIFGGFFVIGHDLWDLKHECERGPSDVEPEQPDRYQRLLGRRADFPFHTAIALVSYFVFGLLPPLVYGFSFQETNDRDLKLLTVAVASVVCIMVLALGKAHVQRPRKSYFKTMAYYVVFGFMVSGASYAFGDLIMKLLEKIGLFRSVDNLGLFGVSSTSTVATY